MPQRPVLIIVLLCLAAAGVSAGLSPAQLSPARAAGGPPGEPLVSSTSLNAGCALVTPSTCKIHVDPFTIPIAPGKTLEAFQIRANGVVIYDYKTDVSNPPTGIFSPTLVKKDFAARCSTRYTIDLLAQDSGDLDPVTIGRATNILCPVATYTLYLPFARR